MCFIRLQQLDQHCQASSQQVLQLLSRQKQLMQERQQLVHDMHNLQAQVSLCYTLYSDLRSLVNFKPDDCLNVSSALPTSRMEALTLLSLLSCKKYCFYYSKINHYRYIWTHLNYMPELYFSDMLSSCDRCRFKSIPFYDFNTFFCLKILVIYPLSVLKLVEKTAQILSLQKSWFYETHKI